MTIKVVDSVGLRNENRRLSLAIRDVTEANGELRVWLLQYAGHLSTCEGWGPRCSCGWSRRLRSIVTGAPVDDDDDTDDGGVA